MDTLGVMITKTEWESMGPLKQEYLKELVRDKCGQEIEIRYNEGDNNEEDEPSS